MLRTAREEKGVSLAQAEAATMIRRPYLQALEDDEHGALPGAVYVKDFLRNYASYLGLDPAHVLSIYHREYPDQSQEVVAPSTIRPRGTSQLVTGGTVATLLLVVVVAIFSTYIYRQVQSFRAAEPPSQALVPTPTPIPPTVTPAPTQSAAPAVPHRLPIRGRSDGQSAPGCMAPGRGGRPAKVRGHSQGRPNADLAGQGRRLRVGGQCRRREHRLQWPGIGHDGRCWASREKGLQEGGLIHAR